MSVVEKLTGSGFKIRLHMYSNGGNVLKFINQENYFPKLHQISNYFDTKYTLVHSPPKETQHLVQELP